MQWCFICRQKEARSGMLSLGGSPSTGSCTLGGRRGWVWPWHGQCTPETLWPLSWCSHSGEEETQHQRWGQYRAEGSEGRKLGGNRGLGERGAWLWSHGLWRRRRTAGLGVPRGSREQGVRGKGLQKWEVGSLLDLNSGAREPGFTQQGSSSL